MVAVGNAFVRVYDMIENQWTQAIADLDLGEETDFFSASIAVSSDGNRVAIGAMLYNDVGNATQVSFVRIFDLTDNEWTQVGLDLECGSVALSSDGNRIAIGGQQSDDDLGAILVRIFDWTGSRWNQVGSTLYDDVLEGYATVRFATLGGSIALSADGDRVAIGSVQTPSGEEGSPSGQVRIYSWTGSDWKQMGSDLGTGIPEVGTNPWEVDLSSDGNRVIMTAPGKADFLGEADLSSVRIYDWVAETQEWVRGVLSLDSDYYASTLIGTATSVAISSDGDRVSLGVAWNNQVFNFAWNGSEWTRMDPELSGGGFTGLRGILFGSSVALALDGDRVVVGAPWDSSASRAGSIEIFGLADPPCIG